MKLIDMVAMNEISNALLGYLQRLVRRIDTLTSCFCWSELGHLRKERIVYFVRLMTSTLSITVRCRSMRSKIQGSLCSSAFTLYDGIHVHLDLVWWWVQMLGSFQQLKQSAWADLLRMKNITLLQVRDDHVAALLISVLKKVRHPA